jgi:hypothetical protein
MVTRESSLPRIFFVPGDKGEGLLRSQVNAVFGRAGDDVKSQQEHEHDRHTSRRVENRFEIFMLHGLISEG